ncbi:HAD family hydrolase [Nocardiopsis sp. SBT366]|uniref:HAD family hydrolase n=1 Tax=Nocardiopsis sp. SBT366 TaxID=1580529 RepID=UPI000AFE812E|nr:HAD-IA family hydrolase [Nocardiopsis sp. SBT366]
MTVEGCMFDFSGTLMRIEPVTDWLRAVLTDVGIAATDAEIEEYAARLDRCGAQPGGSDPTALPSRLSRLWQERDLSASAHRATYTALAREANLPWGRAVYDALYTRHMTPDAWRPYPDTSEVLDELHGRGIPVAVVSNIGWDLRPVLKAHGIAEPVKEFVLSYEHGLRKPDPELFRIACDALGLAPEVVLMVGDDRHADTGALALGCPVHLVDHLPVHARPASLRPVLDLVRQGDTDHQHRRPRSGPGEAGAGSYR